MKTTLNKVILLAALFSGLNAYAGDVTDQIEKDMGAKITGKYQSVAPGYTLVMATKNNKSRAFYEKDGLLFYGIIYNSNGDNLMAIDVANVTSNRAAPKVDETLKSSIKLSDFSDLNYFTSPDANKSISPVYIIFDPNCPYCKTVYQKIKIDKNFSGKDIRWVPVAALTVGNNGSSQLKSIALLSNKKQAFANLDKVSAGTKPATPEEMQTLSTNLSSLVMINSRQVPAFVRFGKNEKAVSFIGMPSDEELNSILK